MYITVHQVQLPERGHRAAAPVQQTQYSSVHQYISTSVQPPPGLWIVCDCETFLCNHWIEKSQSVI